MLSRRDLLRIGLASAASTPLLVRALTQKPEEFVGADVFERLVANADRERWHSLTVGDIVVKAAVALIGTPYVGGTLELYDDREVCAINFAGLDCVTLYENALGFARMIHHRKRTKDDFRREIVFMRYRGGKLDGYVSRLHYTSDWFFDNDRKKVVKDITATLPGAARMNKALNFMSTHPDSYRELRANATFVSRLADIEEGITARRPWYVPNDRVIEIEPLLRNGDIVGIATTLDGLDCSHTGLVAVDEEGVRRFLNASSVRKEVVLGERLSEYALKYKRNLGAMIARPV